MTGGPGAGGSQAAPGSAGVLAIVGPTASGKSELALDLCEEVGGEIVNADAMQLYRGMDVGTAKPTRQERARVAHHALDLWPISRAASVVEYREVARLAVREIQGRGLVPVVVGGSRLYVTALCDRLDVPPTDPQVRGRYQMLLDERGPGHLHDLLVDRDPAAAAAIEPGNGRRLVRALEVVELTGSFRARLPAPHPWRPTTYLGVGRPRPELDERIRARVARMWQHGLVDEVRTLLSDGLGRSPTAGRAVGYPQVIEHLAGRATARQAQESTVVATRRLARRQERALRGDGRIAWLDGSADHLLALAVRAMPDQVRSSGVSRR